MGDRRLAGGTGTGARGWIEAAEGRGEEGPPAKLSSPPTAIEKVKHTPTRGHVTIGEKERSGYLPSSFSRFISLTQPPTDGLTDVYVRFAYAG